MKTFDITVKGVAVYEKQKTYTVKANTREVAVDCAYEKFDEEFPQYWEQSIEKCKEAKK